MKRRVLVAGIGNVFRGDDGFGVEVLQALAMKDVPPGVRLVDFGIRGFDLACALVDDYHLAILIDTAKRGGLPGTLYVIEPEAAGDPQPPEGHSLDPASVLSLARALGERVTPVRIVACEPETFGDEEDGAMGLSVAVSATVSAAVDMVQRLVAEVIDA